VITFTLIIAAQPLQAQTFTIFHNFDEEPNGAEPDAGLTMDGAGNLYGVTFFSSAIQLKHSSSGWRFNLLHILGCCDDGFEPSSPLTIGRTPVSMTQLVRVADISIATTAEDSPALQRWDAFPQNYEPLQGRHNPASDRIDVTAFVASKRKAPPEQTKPRMEHPHCRLRHPPSGDDSLGGTRHFSRVT